MGEFVNREVCDVIHKNLDFKLEEMKDRMEDVNVSIVSLTRISEENQTIIKILMEERAVKLNRSTSRSAVVMEQTSKIWSQPWFKYIVLTGCLALIILILGVTSNSVAEKVVQILDKMPKT